MLKSELLVLINRYQNYKDGYVVSKKYLVKVLKEYFKNNYQGIAKLEDYKKVLSLEDDNSSDYDYASKDDLIKSYDAFMQNRKIDSVFLASLNNICHYRFKSFSLIDYPNLDLLFDMLIDKANYLLNKENLSFMEIVLLRDFDNVFLNIENISKARIFFKTFNDYCRAIDINYLDFSLQDKLVIVANMIEEERKVNDGVTRNLARL